jgi:hypothetical protein
VCHEGRTDREPQTLSRFARLAPQLVLSPITGAGTRSVLIVLSFAVGMALVLLASSVPVASQARAERERRMIPATIEEDNARPPSYSLLTPLPGDFFGQPLVLQAMASVGTQPPVPPGLSRRLRPGEAAVSPAVAGLLESPRGKLLRPRIPGRISMTIKPDGLPSPDALVGYVGVRPSQLPQPQVVVGFGPALAHGKQPLTPGVWIATMLLLIAVLAPIATLLLAATRLSSRTREARFAALRLAGADVTLVRFLAAAESGLLALVGALLGLPLFILARPLFAGFLPEPYKWFPTDLQVGAMRVFVVVLALSSFAVVVSLVSMRQVILTPLGVVRRSTRRPGRPIGLWLILAGLLLLLLAAAAAVAAVDLAMIAVTLGLTSTVLGVILSLPWLVWYFANSLARRTNRLSLLLGSNALATDPGSLGRAAAAIAIVVLVGGTGQAIVLASGPGRTTIGLQRAQTEPSVVFVSASGIREPIPRVLESIAGVRDVERRATDLWGGVGLRYFAAVTDGSPATEERIKNALALKAGVLVVDSARSMRGRQLGRWYALRGLVDGLVTIVLFVVWTGLMVASIQRTIEQRRAMAALAAFGAPSRILRASAVAQVAVPLGISVALGWILSVPITTLLFSAVESRLLFPVRFTVWLISALILFTLATTALMIPWIRGVLEPAALRTE